MGKEIKLNEIEAVLLYNLATEYFIKCIQDKENEFLKDELNISLDAIIYEHLDIKFVFKKLNVAEYLIYISLVLYNENKKIGVYNLVLNDKEEVVDDSIVFD